VSTTPLAFYRLTFESRAASPGYWAVHGFDADGRELADNHSSVYASGDWLRHETFFRGMPGAATCELGFRGREGDMEVRDVAVTPANGGEVRHWSDALYASLPPIAYTPPADRHRLIPRARAGLQGGETVRIVVLGDSVANDLWNTYFDVLVEPVCPGARIEVMPAVVGSKGCGYFVRDAAFQRHVVDLQPDLLMVCTVSNGGGIGPFEALVERVRRSLEAEPVVVSAPLGPDHRFAADDDSERARAFVELMLERRAFAQEQAALSARLGVAYLDLRNPWVDYLDACDRPRNWFHRDETHANDRGKQVVARMIARWLAPVGSAQ
jgi:hypothetical protein